MFPWAMASIHVASAANEVAQALPSTATVTVSKHGIQAIETLNLEAQTYSQDQLMWNRSFSGREIITNPTLHYMVKTEITPDSTMGTAANGKELLPQLRQLIRPTCDPIANAASHVQVTVNNAELTITPNRDSRIVTNAYPDGDVEHQRDQYGLNELDEHADPTARTFDEDRTVGSKQFNVGAKRLTYPKRFYGYDGSAWVLIEDSTADDTYTKFAVIFDIYQPLAHPYFEDNVMRDNTLVNVHHLDVQINLSDVGKMVESKPVSSTNPYTTSNVRPIFGTASAQNSRAFSTSLLLPGDSIGATQGIKPTLIMDLITPSLPMPTIADKTLKLLHTMTNTHVDSALNMDSVRSGNVQLAQVPDKIYVFLRSSKMDEKSGDLFRQVPTRLGVCTELRIRTPQNAGFLLNMDQEALYQMSVRNGSKQSRSAFMQTLGSIICIDPEKDLGGYTNGVLVPFTFEVVGNFSQPCTNGSKSRVWLDDVNGSLNALNSDNDDAVPMNLSGTTMATGETFTLYVVCELNGHLYLMSDGTGKQTKSNLTVTEVADAVSSGIHHPSTFPRGRVSKMDSGVLGEIGKMGPGDMGDDARAAVRA